MNDELLERALASLDDATLRIEAVIDSFSDLDRSPRKRDAVRALWKVEDAEALLRGDGENARP